jgi:hypothetical protein
MSSASGLPSAESPADPSEDAVLTAPTATGMTDVVDVDDSDDSDDGSHNEGTKRQRGESAPVRTKQQKQALATAAQKQLSAIRSEQAKAQKARLRFLLGQSEIFKQ